MEDLRTKNKGTLLKKRKVKKVKKEKIKKLDLNLEPKSKNKKKFSLLEKKEKKKVACTDKEIILQHLLLKNALLVGDEVIQLDFVLQVHRDTLVLIIKR